MTPDLDQHLAEAATAVAAAGDLDALRTVDSELLGKQSVVTEARKTLGGLDEDERKAVGQRLNEVRAEIEALVAARRSALEGEARAEQLEEERLDLTELDRGRRLGHRHVVTQTWERLEDLFVGMGYTVSEGPEIEDEWHNFGALNFPPDHPARDMYDTLYVDHGEPGSTLLRTHTSPVQIRVMEAGEPPIYSIMPGRVFRSDTADATHMPVFHQIEGLVVDRGITFGDLAGTLEAFTRAYFGGDFTSRLRPSYFPFTEPSGPSSTSAAPTERGWSWPAAAWFIPTSWRPAAWIQRNGRVSPSGLASIAWHSCATELTTFANCSATTTVSCRSSDVSRARFHTPGWW
ncbi:MAG: hypothetical protein Ct9H300mP31_11080 [Acidimicrobiaceae bacterium]|nr:MAG: hypothetical protein Ct9H300mP31_11080 [Acidimicrobiaceae bacterium]